MLLRVPDYFERFRCLAGACPHTCCAKWEVVIDEETAQRYQELSGPLGEKMRAVLRYDEDGDACFPLDGGRCPFLDGENLCEIHRQLGEAATSVTCREHPRFMEEYGPFREITLSASCPAANALLLGSDAPLTFREEGTMEEQPDDDTALLLALRDRLMAVLEDRREPLRHRLERFLTVALAAQDALDGWDEDALSALTAGERAPEPPRVEDGPGLFPDALRLLSGLEVLEPDWRTLLYQAEAAPASRVPEPLLERTAVYFAFRYLLKAVNDGDLLSRAQLCLLAVLTVERLAAVMGLPEALRRFSCEVEHDDGSLDALLEAFRRETLPLAAFFRELR